MDSLMVIPLFGEIGEGASVGACAKGHPAHWRGLRKDTTAPGSNRVVDRHVCRIIPARPRANPRLRHRFAEEADKRGVTLALPDPVVGTDDATMIGVAGVHWLAAGRLTDWTETVDPSMTL